MKKAINIFLVLSAILTTDLLSQTKHRMGLLPQDISKEISRNPMIIRVEPKAVPYGLSSYADNSANMPPVGDQGIQGSCVAWAAGYYYKSYQAWQDYHWSITDSNHLFSPAFIYHNINGGQDSGSYVTDAMTLLAYNGCATMADFPYNDSDYATWPPESAYRDAINYRSGVVYALQTTDTMEFNVIKELLADGDLAILAINVYENFDSLNTTNDVYCVKNLAGKLLGGHALTFVGYDDNKVTLDGTGAFKMINQWGTGWGDKGYCWMSYQAVMSTVITQGWAFYTYDRGKYSPTLIASVQFNHPNINALYISLGTGPNDSLSFSIPFFNFTMKSTPGLTARPAPATPIDFDLSDISDSLNNNQSNNVFLSAESTAAGTVNNFSVTQLKGPYITGSTQTPKTIPGTYTTVYTDINLTLGQGNIPAKVIPASPLEYSTTTSLPVQLKWMSNLLADSYSVQLGIDSTFATTLIDTTGVKDTSLTVLSLSNPATYFWRVNAANSLGTGLWSQAWSFKPIITGIDNIKNKVPVAYNLNQNYPNPFNPATVISYALPFASNVKIEVYNILGIRIKELLNGQKAAGYYELNFNTAGLSSGVYLYMIEAKSMDGKNEYINTKKMMLLK
jgi:hypothetical protein